MNYKVRLPSPTSRRALPGLVLTALLLLRLATPLRAEDHYLASGHPDGVALLAPPPATGSAEEAADLASVQSVFKARTPDETSRAEKEEGLSFSLFEPAVGPVFQPGKLPQTEALLKKVKKEIGEAINIPKNHWKRLRPYQMDSQLCFSCPTGKKLPATRAGIRRSGTVYRAGAGGNVSRKARRHPWAIGRQNGWDRVLIGKHYPTDVRAGRVLAQAIVRELQSSPTFQHDLAEAKAEVKAVDCSRSAGSSNEASHVVLWKAWL